MSPATRALLLEASDAGAEARALVQRALDWCDAARIEPHDFTALQAWSLGHVITRLAPGAWSGRIPPVTRSGRHRRIDEYVLRTPWRTRGQGGTFVDLGCGFPPLTTLESAETLGPGWRVIGADPALHPYLLTEPDVRYACFDAAGEVVYFQPLATDLATWQHMLADGAATRAYYRSKAEPLRASLDRLGDAGPAAVEWNGIRLERDAVRRFERSNVRFVQAGLLDLDVDGIDIARCFNVLVFFDREFRDRALGHVASRLAAGGLFLCGADWTDTSAAHYSVFRREGDELVAKEFAFGIDNVRPVIPVPFVSFADGNPEIARLARVVGVLRSDDTFRRGFDADLDAILRDLDLCPRGPDGTLGGVDPDVAPDELERRLAAVEPSLVDKGWVQKAVQTLRHYGVDAWTNCVGHVAVGPESADACAAHAPVGDH